MQVKILRFLRSDNGSFFMPTVILGIAFFLILFNPLIPLKIIQAWMLTPFLIIAVSSKFNNNQLKKIRNFIPFLIYISIHFLFSFLLQGLIIDSIFKYLLFLITYFSFLIFLSQIPKIEKNKPEIERFINAIILFVGIYGIYQFVGRQFGLPFTLNDILRYREYKVGGFYQANSFFEEPAYFSQFLITMLFIQLFFFKARYVKICILIMINIIFTISVTGIASMFILIILFSISKIRINITRVVSRRIFRIGVLLITIITAIIILVVTSNVGSYIEKRIKNSIVSKQTVEQLNKKQLKTGGSVEYDRSGYERVVNEVNVATNTLASPYGLFGYGIDYSRKLPDRKMGLNAMTEIIVRWGFIGLFLFLVPILLLLRNSPHFRYLVLFLFLYSFIDGAIAKLSFWFLLSIILILAESYKIKTT